MGAYSKDMFTEGEILDAVFVGADYYAVGYGYYALANSNFRVYIPKLMSKISQGDAKIIKTISAPSGDITNSTATGDNCKPSLLGIIHEYNYVTAGFAGYFYYPYISYGAGVKVETHIEPDGGLSFKVRPELANPSWDFPDYD